MESTNLPHFELVKNIKIRLGDKPYCEEHDDIVKPYCEIVIMGVQTFQNRIANKFSFSVLYTIDNSLEIVVEYILMAVAYVGNLIKIGDGGVCPFQLDLCFAVGATKLVDGDGDDDHDYDDDDDDDDEKGAADAVVDPIGDIDLESQLNASNLAFCAMKQGDGDNGTVPRRNFFRHGFQSTNGLSPRGNEPEHAFFHRKRTILAVDLRDKESEGERAFMFQPPDDDTLNIPKNEVPEWYMASTAKTILPGIGAKMDCDGSLLTVSIHALEKDKVKVYLWWNGMVIRFMPEDIRTVLPKIFNMEFDENQDFITLDGRDGDIEKMNEVLEDVDFNIFRDDQ